MRYPVQEDIAFVVMKLLLNSNFHRKVKTHHNREVALLPTAGVSSQLTHTDQLGLSF